MRTKSDSLVLTYKNTERNVKPKTKNKKQNKKEKIKTIPNEVNARRLRSGGA